MTNPNKMTVVGIALALSGILAGLLTSAVALAQSAVAPIKIDDSVYASAQRLVQVEPGRHLNLYCKGTGSPVVVFDSGLTDETAVWGLVQPAIARKTRTCSYDRAGIGFSDPSPHAGTSQNIANDLHRLLRAAGERPPYVLVGHSYGGLNVRYFASKFPTEVVGMVLVDPSAEDYFDQMNKQHPQWHQQRLLARLSVLGDCALGARTGFIPESALYKKCINPPDPRMSEAINAAHLTAYLRPGFQNAQRSEESNLLLGVSADQVRAVRKRFADMPLVVLSRAASATPPQSTETQQERDNDYRDWLANHQAIADLSSRGMHKVVENSGHYIQVDQPQAVIDAIVDVLTTSEK